MSNARAVERASIALRAAIEAQHRAEASLASETKRLTAIINDKEAKLWHAEEAARQDRLTAFSAKLALARYAKMPCVACGQSWHAWSIDYDPEQDPEIIAAIERGELPKPTSVLQLAVRLDRPPTAPVISTSLELQPSEKPDIRKGRSVAKPRGLKGKQKVKARKAARRAVA